MDVKRELDVIFWSLFLLRDAIGDICIDCVVGTTMCKKDNTMSTSKQNGECFYKAKKKSAKQIEIVPSDIS